MDRRLFVALALFVGLGAPAGAATGTIAPAPKHQFFDNSGAPCSGCLLFTYQAGTSTKSSTYSDAALSTANTDPIVLDSAGRATIFLPAASFKLILSPSTDTDPPTSPLWTVDNVSNVPSSAADVDVTGTAGETLSANDAVYLSLGDGGRTAGRWYKADADFDYASSTAQAMGFAISAISSGASGTIRIAGRITGLSALSAGTAYYASATAGAITSTPPTNSRKMGIADSSTTLVSSHWTPISDASGTVPGLVNLSAQTLGAGVKSFTDHPQFEPGTSSGTFAPVSGVLSVNTTQVGNVGAGEDDLMSYTLPANVLSANAKGIHIKAGGTMTNPITDITVKFYWGGTAIVNQGAFAAPGGAGFLAWVIDVWIFRTGTGAQRYWIEGRNFFTASWSSGSVQGFASTGTAAKDETATQIIKATCQSARTTDNDCVQNLMFVETVY